MSCCNNTPNINCCNKSSKPSYVGITATWSGTAKESLKCCELLKCRCAQLYGHGIYSSTNKDIKMLEKKELDQYLNEKNITLVCHAPTCINLANETEEKKYRGMLQSELNDIADLPAVLNFHIGNNGTIEQVAQNINMMTIKQGRHEKYHIQLVAEVSAGVKGQLGSTFEELRKLNEAVDQNKLGFCIDTCHVFGSGMSDFMGHESIVKLFDNFEEFGGKVKLIHLNDSKADFKSGVDRHAELEKGKIWNGNNESLKSLVQRITEHEIDAVLETGSSQLRDLKRIQEYMKEF